MSVLCSHGRTRRLGCLTCGRQTMHGFRHVNLISPSQPRPVGTLVVVIQVPQSPRCVYCVEVLKPPALLSRQLWRFSTACLSRRPSTIEHLVSAGRRCTLLRSSSRIQRRALVVPFGGVVVVTTLCAGSRLKPSSTTTSMSSPSTLGPSSELISNRFESSASGGGLATL